MIGLIVLSHNDAEFAVQCIDSIKKETLAPHEIILINNGSNDDNTKLLESIEDVTYIKNNENKGFAGGNNQGIKLALEHGCDHVCLLNADTTVTSGWLISMLKHFVDGSKTGIVGPITNYGGLPEQQLKGHDGKQPKRAFEIEMVAFFCTLIHKDLIDEIGLLDERFGKGNYEDTDYCRRARNAGWKIMVDGYTYVHHFGSKCYSQMPDFGTLIATNKKLYEKKWAAYDKS